MARCLSLGAADYWVKPLRANEVRNLWTRLWHPTAEPSPRSPHDVALGESSSGNEGSGARSEDVHNGTGASGDPTSGEGSAPDDLQRIINGSGSGVDGKAAAGGTGAGVDESFSPDGNNINGSGSGSPPFDSQGAYVFVCLGFRVVRHRKAQG